MTSDWTVVREALDVSANFSDLVNTPWYRDATYAHFSAEEYQRRHDAARKLMAESGIDALILTGSQNVYSMGSGVTWATGLIDSRGMCQYAVLPAAGDCTLVYPHPGCHIEAARQMVGVSDVRDGRHGHYADVVADRLRELGLTAARIGVTLADRTGDEYMGQSFYSRLREELPDLEIVLMPDILHRLTFIKSPEEIAAMKVAGTLATRGLEAVAERAGEGVAEYQLAAAATHAILDGGGHPHLIMIGATSMADPKMVFPNPFPSGRRLSHGDVILCEIAALYMGYSAKVGHPISVGPPTARYERFFGDVVAPGFEQLQAQLREGNTLDDVQRAGRAFRHSGAQSRPILMHGLDLITADPFVMTDRIRAADYDRTLRNGMTFNIEITPIDAAGDLGIFVSRSFEITGDAPNELTPYPMDAIIATD